MNSEMNPEKFKEQMDNLRTGIKALCQQANDVKSVVQGIDDPEVFGNKGEMMANMMLAFRHLEDAAMRFGKAIQASDTGESPLGGPDSPK